MTFDELIQRRPAVVQIVVYPTRTVYRTEFGKKTFDERHSHPVLTKRRRKKLKVKKR